MTDICYDDVCITCSDQLVPVLVVALSDDGSLASGERDGEPCEISVELIEDVRVGETLLVHGGVALQRGDARLLEATP